MLDALKFARRIVEAESFRDILIGEVLPGSAADSDDDLKEYIRNTIQTVFHPVGTAAMLPREGHGVVDNTLKVYGTSNLRVVGNLEPNTTYASLLTLIIIHAD